MSKKEAVENEKKEAIARLKGMIKRGDTVHTVLRHKSASGMRRTISVVVPSRYKDHDGKMRTDLVDISGTVARAAGYRYDGKRGGLIANGCGMDMGYEIVHTVGRILYPRTTNALQHRWI